MNKIAKIYGEFYYAEYVDGSTWQIKSLAYEENQTVLAYTDGKNATFTSKFSNISTRIDDIRDIYELIITISYLNFGASRK